MTAGRERGRIRARNRSRALSLLAERHPDEFATILAGVTEASPVPPPTERTLMPCGTKGAISRHYRNREPPCDACRAEQKRINSYYRDLRTGRTITNTNHKENQ